MLLITAAYRLQAFAANLRLYRQIRRSELIVTQSGLVTSSKSSVAVIATAGALAIDAGAADYLFF